MEHFILGENAESVTSTYLSTLITYASQGPEDHPIDYSVRAAGPLVFDLYHGRYDTHADMDDWGFDGPKFGCLSVIHSADHILLQHCDPQSIALADRLGLRVVDDTVILEYFADLVVIPHFRGDQVAYFGDHVTKRAD